MESPRKPGRPPKPDRGSRVSAWLSQSEHDQLVALARQRDESVSALVRTILRHVPRKGFPPN
jgi:hypothetical protein